MNHYKLRFNHEKFCLNILLSILILYSFVSCDNNKSIENKYFPIKVGSSWRLVQADIEEGFLLNITIDSLLAENENQYYRFRYETINSKNDSIYFSHVNSRYLFPKNDGNIFEYINFSNKIIHQYSKERIKDKSLRNKNGNLIYKFNGPIGEKWYSLGSPGFILNGDLVFEMVTVTLESKSDTVITKLGTFKDCYRFRVEFSETRDMDYYEWFAKEIGIVKRSEFNEEMAFTLENYTN